MFGPKIVGRMEEWGIKIENRLVPTDRLQAALIDPHPGLIVTYAVGVCKLYSYGILENKCYWSPYSLLQVPHILSTQQKKNYTQNNVSIRSFLIIIISYL